MWKLEKVDEIDTFHNDLNHSSAIKFEEKRKKIIWESMLVKDVELLKFLGLSPDKKNNKCQSLYSIKPEFEQYVFLVSSNTTNNITDKTWDVIRIPKFYMPLQLGENRRMHYLEILLFLINSNGVSQRIDISGMKFKYNQSYPYYHVERLT